MTHPSAHGDAAAGVPACLDLAPQPAPPPVVDALLEVMEARWRDSPADRLLHDGLAWELVSAIPLPPGAHVIEADRRGARWTRRWIERGHRVTTLAGEAAPCDAADLVLANATVQSARDPDLALEQLAALLRPGGRLCVRVENLLSLVLGLRREERRAGRTQRRLYDSATLKAALMNAGLVDVRCHALAVTASASGRLAASAPLDDRAGLYGTIDRLAARDPLLADAGLQILAIGRRP